MANNPSVAKFRTDMANLGAGVGRALHEEVLAQADELISNMYDAAPKDTGRLASSLRKRDLTRGGRGPGRLQEVSVLVIAGGPATIKRTHQGNAYDYSIATEFGTQKEAPEPFFYTTFRRYRTHGLEILRETVDDAIRENNQLRAMRSDGNYNMVAHRGAVLNTKVKR